MKKLLTKVLKFPFYIYLRLHQRQYKDLKYLKFNRKSKVLAVVFSAFGADDKTRSYNYVRSFSGIPIDFLFLADPWGYRGSYFMLHEGSSEPALTTQQLVNQEVIQGGVFQSGDYGNF